MPPKSKKGGAMVGRALMRRHQQQGPAAVGDRDIKELEDRKVLSSVLEMSSLDDFLDTAMMAQRDFSAIKERDLLILDATTGGLTSILPRSQVKPGAKKGTTTLAFRQLKVPRRPAWHTGMTAMELDRAEKDGFLEWRREIAGLEEQSGDRAKVTPFEKNLEEVLTNEARKERLREMEEMGEEEFEEEGLGDEGREEEKEEEEEEEAAAAAALEEVEGEEDEEEDEKDVKEDLSAISTTRILTRDELINRLKCLTATAAEAFAESAAAAGHTAPKPTIGMVGFPNVGKSSVINVLMGVTALDHDKARVAVSSTPGKTKHFQTLPLDKDTMLCDCPGLVFPSFVATSADMPPATKKKEKEKEEEEAEQQQQQQQQQQPKPGEEEKWRSEG
eukprot:evm.model.NODE_9837_length_4545_cov_20.612541.2